MADGKPYELSLELSQGECRVLVDGLALNICLKPPTEGVITAAPRAMPAAAPLPQLPQGNGAENQKLMEELDYYRQVSTDIYKELGQLAKTLNLSLQEVTLAEVMHCQEESPGEHLDQARMKLNDVLEMTEKATLNILDLVEQIREDCESVRSQLISLGPQEENWEEGLAADSGPAPTIWSQESKDLLSQIVSQAQELNLEFQGQSAAEPAPEPEEAPPGLHFPLGEILQIVLEFCGNEALKQHLKAVIAKQGELFHTQEAEAAFARLGASQPEEDGFSQFPVEEVLKILQGSCDNKRIQDLFAKMLASAGKLFPMPMLPLEGQKVEAAAPPPPAAPAAAQPLSFLPQWEDLFQKIQELAAQSEKAPEAPPSLASAIDAETIQETSLVLDRISAALSRIMEALAFQDLSGQRLLQVLKLLRTLQFQILTMVVAAGTKLKKKAEQSGITVEESGALAQDEIDRVLATLAPPPSSPEAPEEQCVEAQVLDQDAINDLLTNMGF
ncbi:MAG: protein phosphatase CheZ [Syntrophales bacterium]|nr:protein phosphatase CheZ [Syntrophales bacterium]